MTISVALVEDHAVTRELWAEALDAADGFHCAGQFGDAESAMVAMPALQPDVVLMDINLPGSSGVECVRTLKPRMPGTQFVMITVYEDANHIFEALAAGATGYLLKSTMPHELLEAVREVRAGGSPMASNIARKVVASFQSQNAPSTAEESSLTAREREVLDWLVKGYLYKEIGDALGISVPTVSSHIQKIYEKLHVRSRAQAVARYVNLPRSS
jgi:DNA-binding NarL/FixJ family response regulator